MPDAVMMLVYPASKPLNAKGYVTRLVYTQDLAVALVPEAAVNALEAVAAAGRGDAAPSAAGSDLGRVDAVAPEPTSVTTESAAAEIRGV